MELVVALFLGLMCLGIFFVGALMMFYFWRSGRDAEYYDDAYDYGDLVQCAHCGYMNPRDAAACLSCRRPLPHAQAYAPPPAPVKRPPELAPVQRPPQPAPLPEPPAHVDAWIDGVSGAAAGQRFILNPGDTLVGRSTACTIQIPDPKVSRRHFVIRFGKGAYYLQDQESSRGTNVNGQRVMAQRLTHGDRIQIGDTILVFHQRSASA